MGGLATLVFPLESAAQGGRTMTVSRQIDGESEMDVRIRYGAGELRLAAADPGMLYRMELRYDERAFDPIASFDGTRLDLGVEGRGRNIRLGKDHSGSMHVWLPRGVDLTLDLDFGAVRADLDLGGLSMLGLELSTGASDSRVDVSSPNPKEMESASFAVGAADFTARRLGNLNARDLDVSAGVGGVTLDFTGEWRRDLDVRVGMGLGSLELRFPEGLGVRLVKKSFLTSLDSEGLIKRGDSYLSPDWDEATHRVTVHVDAAFGSVGVVWLR